MTAVPDIVWLNLPLFIVGLIIIIKGSDLFLDSAVWVARAFGVPQIIIGATIVSLCTTLPELVSSCAASLKGSGDMALGNAVGSIFCNTGLILGVVLLLIGARIRREVFLIKGIFMLGGLLFGLFLVLPAHHETGLRIDRFEGLILLVFLVIFLVVNYYESLHMTGDAKLNKAEEDPARGDFSGWGKHMACFMIGAVTVAIGAYMLVEFGQRMALNFGVSEAVVSVLFVALGTSLPELFTAIAAIRKKAQDISVGNIFGANVLNMALVVGASATIRPLTPSDKLLARMDIPAALIVCSIVFFAGLIKGKLGKKTGLTLLGCYAVYTVVRLVMGRAG
ncbi:MAG: calcium/sodium antiporter [Lentisphaeria bacterium]|nr:calcium/sodium antiporter [Lentisphaeria bacterium]